MSVGASTTGHERLIDELADVFSEAETARLVVERAGVPRRHIPRFSTPLVFWSSVIQAVLDGQIGGGVGVVVAAAKKLRPANRVFSNYPTADRPSGTPPIITNVRADPGPGRAVGGKPTHTSIMLDRTEAWGSLVEACSSQRHDQSNLVFIVHGDEHQDLGLFMRRIETFFDDRDYCDRIHHVLPVRPEHDLSRAESVEDWERATWAATRSGIPPMEEALDEQTLERPLLLLLSGSEPLRNLDAAQRSALKEFVVDRLPEVLRAVRLTHPVRVVVPIENEPGEASSPLVEELYVALQGVGPELRTRPPIRLEPPVWVDILVRVTEEFKRRGAPLSDDALAQVRAQYEALTALRPKPRLQQVADRLHVLIETLVREAKGRR